ncbi:MAG: alpha-mannosidase [Phycisphaeraceae bacterium]
MHKHPVITEERLRVAIDRTLRPMVHRRTAPVEVSCWDVGGEPVPYEQAIGADYHRIAVGERWGAAWDTTWFRIAGALPRDWHGEAEAVLSMSLGPDPTWCEGISCEGLAWQDGRPVAAVNLYRDDVLRFERIAGGERFEVYVEAAANIRPENVADGSWHVPADPGGDKRFVLERCELRTFDRAAWRLLIAYELLLGLHDQLPAHSARRGQLLWGLNEALNVLGAGDAGRVAEAYAVLGPLLSCKNADHAHRVSAVGHAHIDTAWLWPLRETIRKCARTFTSALNYMDQYPGYVFACSQPQQYAWMKRHYPAIYERIEQAVKRGQWNPIGSMWVEADCNLPSGESLVRQFLHGKRFFKEAFGVETRDLWLPDVFGYSANLPQIMAGCGVDRFLTQKISWNQFNTFPHHTFMWRGIDGTQTFTHFPPTDTYNGTLRPDELVAGVERFRDHDRATRSLYPFGHGDGGGGPTREMLEAAPLMADLQGLPRVTIEPVNAFFDQAMADAKDPPTWVGELYLEYHRGTYTSQAWIKRANRQSEAALHDAELLEAMRWLSSHDASRRPAPIAGYRPPPLAMYETPSGAAGATTPAALLDRAWKLLLLNQFHDIIPGSSIAWVYEDARRDFGVIASLAGAVREHATEALLGSGAGSGARERAGGAAAVVNTLGHARREVVDLPDGSACLVDVPACGYAACNRAEGRLPHERVVTDQTEHAVTLTNGLLTVSIDRRTGWLDSVIDHRADGRQVLAALPGVDRVCGNVLMLHHDRPNKWDAWDIDPYVGQAVDRLDGPASVAVIQDTPLRAGVELVYRFGGSTLTQRVVMRAASARIDFETEVDWQERHRLLKVAFPVAVRSERAAYEVQFGAVERPTHANTSWDLARFEVCAHRWADLSEGGSAASGGYGVALMNDCKYGYDVRDHVMRLSLLRAPIEPDPQADRGRHTFTYALYPHPGDRAEAGVAREARNLNSPMRVVACAPDHATARHSWFRVDRPAVVIDTVKLAEDGGGLVVRLYEAYGTRGRARLTVPASIARAALADLLEQAQQALTVDDAGVCFDYGPYQIVTVRLFPGESGQS